ncbi:hypothetical protein LLH23_01155 [bacterium]|nr:hypothetical protein [bacterium]
MQDRIMHTTHERSAPGPHPGARGVTPRALLIACLLLPLNAYWVIQMEVVRYQGHPTTVSLFYNSVFILLVFLLVNHLLAKVFPRCALHRNEMLVIYLMVTIASALGSHDLIEVVAPQVVTPFYLASPENKWEQLFFQYIPNFISIRDPRIFEPAFEGYSTFFTKERMLAWAVPGGSWAIFLAVLSTIMLAMNALLRRRWMDLERLNYPITHLPLDLSEPGLPLLRNKLMWVGFGLAALVDIINGVHELVPAWPLIKVRVVHYDQYMGTLLKGYPWRALAGTRISFYPFAVGLGMLLPLDLAFSSWFFYLFWKAQRLGALLVGMDKIPGFPYVEEQSSAAYLGLTAFALWMARHYLRNIWQDLTSRGRGQAKVGERGAAGPAPPPQGAAPLDAGEPMAYPVALWIIAAGFVFLLLFAHALGMWAWVAIIFFAIYFGISLAVTRVRAELGPPAHDLHRGGPDLILTNLFGTDRTVLDAQQLTSLKLCFWFNRAYRAHPMPIQLEAFKIAQMSGIKQSSMAWALTLATFVGVFSAWTAQVHLFYSYGMAARAGGTSRYFGQEPFTELASWLNAPFHTRWPRIGAYVVGFLFTWLLMTLRVNFIWWPFHPVGYAISSSWSMNCLWLPILIAWCIKWVILRYFGFKSFQNAIPFALGLVLGEFVVGSLWTIIGIALQINTYSFWV